MSLRTQFRCPHREHAPALSGGFSRRQFFGSAVGLAVGAGLSKPLGAQNGNPHVDATPKPIPGGSSPFGVPVHHFAVTPNTTPIFGKALDPNRWWSSGSSRDRLDPSDTRRPGQLGSSPERTFKREENMKMTIKKIWRPVILYLVALSLMLGVTSVALAQS